MIKLNGICSLQELDAFNSNPEWHKNWSLPFFFFNSINIKAFFYTKKDNITKMILTFSPTKFLFVQWYGNHDISLTRISSFFPLYNI